MPNEDSGSLLSGVEFDAAGDQSQDDAGKADDAAKAGDDGEAGKAAEGAGDGADGGKDDDQSGDEGKGDDDAGKDGKDDDGADELTGAPEAYEDFTIPDGFEVDKAKLDDFLATAKSLNLSQKGAQVLVDKHIDSLKEVAETQQQAWSDLRKEWRGATEADKDIGGAKLNTSLAQAKAAIKQFGTPEFAEVIETFGLGDNPHVIKTLAKIGAAVSEDTTNAGGGSNAPQKQSLAQRIYTSHK